jgi:phosphoglycerol transferase
MVIAIIQYLSVAALVGLARLSARVFTKTLLSLLSSLVLLLIIIDTVFKKVAGSSFNDAILFHLLYGIEGAGLGDFKSDIIKFSSLTVVGLVSIWFLAFKKRSPFRTISTDLTLGLTGVLVFAFSAVTNPFSQAVWKVLNPNRTETFVDFYVKPEITSSPTKKPNLVWIYAESLERTYLDESLFPGLTPGLKELEASSASFTNIEQLDSTGWTIAGMVATQCGIPLTTTGGNGNSMSGINYFLPGVRCLGDLLRGSGYHLAYLGGADLNFAGKGKFYQSHDFHEVLGRAQLESKLPDKSYVNGWGLYDDSLFGFVREKYEQLLTSSKKPFALVTLTVDTHHPEGHISQACHGLKYRSGNNAMLNAVHCADKLITQLVRDMRALDRDNNTVIVVSSDHLAMTNTASNLLARRDRRNLLMINWPDHIKPRQVNRLATPFGASPTVLGLMGFKTNGVGLGRDILEAPLLLTEAYQDHRAALSSWMPEFKKAWQLPKDVKEIIIRPKSRQVVIGTSSFSIPALMTFNSKKDMVSLVFPEGEYDFSLSSPTEQIVLVDDCDHLEPKFPELKPPRGSLCLIKAGEDKPLEINQQSIVAI